MTYHENYKKQTIWDSCNHSHSNIVNNVCQNCGTIIEDSRVDYAFENRQGVIAYQYDNDANVLKCSNGDQLIMSANYYRARTEKGRENLKVTKINKRNWKAAATWHADKLGFFKKISISNLSNYDFNNLPQGKRSTFLSDVIAAIENEFRRL